MSSARSRRLGGLAALTTAVLAFTGFQVLAPSAAEAAGTSATLHAVHLNGDSSAATPTITVADHTVTFESALSVPVQVSAPGATPSGTVTISDSTKALGSATLANGSATVALPQTLAVGVHSLTASYSGDGSVGAGSTSFTVTVLKADVKVYVCPKRWDCAGLTHGLAGTVTVLVVAPSITPDLPNGSDGLPPSGTVTLREGARVLGTADVGRLTLSMTAMSSGLARVPIKARSLRLGAHTLTATYSGDSSFNEAKDTGKVTVRRTSASTISAYVAPVTPRHGMPVQLELQVTTAAGVTARGQLDVRVDGRTVTVPLKRGQGVARLGSFAKGSYWATVTYAGSSHVAGSKMRVRIKVA